MGEVKHKRLIRGKRVVEVVPVSGPQRDPRTVAALIIRTAREDARAMLTDDERLDLIEALGGSPA